MMIFEMNHFRGTNPKGLRGSIPRQGPFEESKRVGGYYTNFSYRRLLLRQILYLSKQKHQFVTMRMDLGSNSTHNFHNFVFQSFGLGAPPVRSICLPRPFFPFLPDPPPPPLPAASRAAARVSPRLALSGGGT